MRMTPKVPKGEEYLEEYLDRLEMVVAGPNSSVDPRAIRLTCSMNLQENHCSTTAFTCLVDALERHKAQLLECHSPEEVQSMVLTIWVTFEGIMESSPPGDQLRRTMDLMQSSSKGPFRGANAILSTAIKASKNRPFKLAIPGLFEIEIPTDLIGLLANGLLVRVVSVAPPEAQQEFVQRAIEALEIGEPVSRLSRALGLLATACSDRIQSARRA